MRITIEVAEAAPPSVRVEAATPQSVVASAAPDEDGGPPPAMLLAALGEARVPDAASPPGAPGGMDAGGPPAWLEEMIASLRRPLA